MTETIIGVDLGGTKVSVGAVADGAVDKIVRREVPAQEAADVVLGVITDAITELFDSTVVGIGCGVPSVVDVERGIVFDVENIPTWKEMHLKAALEDRFNVPALINNDANAFVVGEFVFGKGRGFQNVVGMTLGTGLGTGVIVAGRLFSGGNCGVGEIGMMDHKGMTLEEHCSGPFFPREFGAGGDVIYQRALDREADALAAYHRYGRELSEAVMIALYAYDPDALIFGGSISVAYELFKAGLREGLDRFAYPRVVEGLVIDRSELDNAAVLGAAALYVDAMG